ncbi:MAG: multiheme c-type cytochrome [Planctomycetota bacterium]|jgi:formate-dependent nitrite reductase cytochrome c552 subunit
MDGRNGSLRTRLAASAGVAFFLAGIAAAAVLLSPGPVRGQEGPQKGKEEEKDACVECHEKDNPGLVHQWRESVHFQEEVTCLDCHGADKEEPDAFEHYDETIAVIVTPKDCAECHEDEAEQFMNSKHSKGGRILGSLDNFLAEVVEGTRTLKTKAFPEGVSPAAALGCWECHGSEVKVVGEGKLDPATWPNTGIGRINPDGSEGSCTACHSRHLFSLKVARSPDACGKCHMGPDHPQLEIYNESKHGIAFRANIDKMNLGKAEWVLGVDYSAAPTCATCHMSATKTLPRTHSIGERISWNNRPAVSVRPEASDKKFGLPTAAIGWRKRRDNMKNVCVNCHNKNWVDNFYVKYDAFIHGYNEKYGAPGERLAKIAKKILAGSENFANKIDFIWFELWHHEGRRARHGASMMGPDFTHWHGTYELAKHWYSEFVPELNHLVKKGEASDDPEKRKAAAALKKALDEVLASEPHKWFLGRMDPEERAKRKKAIETFKKRYEEEKK